MSAEVTVPEGDAPRLGKDELNLAEFPIALLASRPPRNAPLRLEFRDGPKEWAVEGSPTHGLPTAGDIEVYVVLMEITRLQNFPLQVQFCRHDVIRRLGWDAGGKTYDRLQQALDRLVGVTIYTRNAFFDARQRLWEHRKAFHVLEAYDITDSRQAVGPESAPHPSWIRWSPELYANLQAGYIKSLDVSLFLSLKSAISQALYRYLDKKRYDGKPLYRMNLRTLVFEHLGMSRTYYLSEAKHKLKPAHEELVRVGFLRDVEYGTMKSGEEMVTYHFTPREWREPPSPPPGSDLARKLMERGLSRQLAQELAARDPEECERQLRYLPSRNARDEGAILAKAIREGWSAPPGADEPRPTAPRPRAPRASTQQERAKQERHEAAFDAWWDSLPPESREQVRTDALATLRQESEMLAQLASRNPQSPLLRTHLKRLSGWAPGQD